MTIVENILVHILHSNNRQQAGNIIDHLSRWLFPLVYIIVMAVLVYYFELRFVWFG